MPPQHLHLRPPPSLQLSGDVESNWRGFKQHFLLYLKAWNRDKSGEHWKVAKLLNVAGPQAQVVYNTFHFDRPEDKLSLDVVLEKFDFHCSQERNQAFWRYVFRSRTQQQGESFDSFLSDLQLKAQTCSFGPPEVTNSMVRDQLVFGLQDQALQAKLMTVEGLTLWAAVEICRATRPQLPLMLPPPPQQQMLRPPHPQQMLPPQMPAPLKSFKKQSVQDVKPLAREIPMEAVGGVNPADIPPLSKAQRRRLRGIEKRKEREKALSDASMRECPVPSEPLCTTCLEYHNPDDRCLSSPCSSENNAKRQKMQDSGTVEDDRDDQGDDSMACDALPHHGDAWSQNYLDGNVPRRDDNARSWYLDTVPDNL